MNVLIIGNGGREHALAWKVAQSPSVSQVYIAPGNGGTAREPRCQNVAIAADDVPGLLRFAQSKQIDLTIVGPEAPLVKGVSDAFAAAGLRCFGPTQAAARLEGSKAFAKDFLARHRIPTARYATFTELNSALSYIAQHDMPLVVKADGLAAGKGVIIAQTRDEADAAVRDMLGKNAFGAAGKQVVIEQFLVGEEASFIVMVDGLDVIPMATSQDHKARDDGDRGPNTGGMGAYSPAPVVTPEVHARVMRDVILPTVRGLHAEGMRYRGFLYAGLMIDAQGEPSVLEFNCRFGDPETQPIMMRLKSDLATLCLAAVEGQLGSQTITWDERPALGVVMAAENYPGTVTKGDVIRGLPESDAPDCKVFHAGTELKEGLFLTNGGRVLCVTALGATVQAAQQRVYQTVTTIQCRGMFFRHDIGYRAIAREQV